MKAFGEQGFQTVLFIAESSESTTVACIWDDYNNYMLNELDEQVDLQKMIIFTINHSQTSLKARVLHRNIFISFHVRFE